MLKAILTCLVVGFAPGAALAKTFDLTIKNGYTDVLTGLSIGGGKVEAFKTIPASGKRTFSVTLPEGKCEARISVTFANGQHYDAGKFDFCEYDLLNLWFE
jgi:hypothetical protein